MVVNAIGGKISVPRDLIKLVEGIRKRLVLVKDISINYCSMVCNRMADRMTQSAHRYSNGKFVLCVLFNKFIYFYLKIL